jgi:hypothetical protein
MIVGALLNFLKSFLPQSQLLQKPAKCLNFRPVTNPEKNNFLRQARLSPAVVDAATLPYVVDDSAQDGHKRSDADSRPDKYGSVHLKHELTGSSVWPVNENADLMARQSVKKMTTWISSCRIDGCDRLLWGQKGAEM